MIKRSDEGAELLHIQSAIVDDIDALAEDERELNPAAHDVE